MRVFTVIANLGWNLPRFLRQIGWLVLGLAGLCAMAFGGWVFLWYFNWGSKGTTDEEFAAMEALAIPDNFKPCRGADNHSKNNPGCYIPDATDLRHCRWWMLEDCRAFKMPDFILSDPVKLGTMLKAMMHPCPYLLARSRREFVRSRLNETCPTADTEIPRGPIVIEFVGDKKSIIMRID